MERRDAGPETSGPVVLFDGVCNLCNATVAFIIRRDRGAVFRFAALQSAAAAALLAGAGVGAVQPGSIVLVERGRAHVRSEAVLRIARRLGLPWSMLGAAGILPRRLRDWVYDRVAGNRYRLFGRREACLTPTPELRARFLDA